MKAFFNSTNINFTKTIINHGIIAFNPKSKISFIKFSNHDYFPIHQINSILIYDPSKFKHGTEIESLTSNEYHELSILLLTKRTISYIKKYIPYKCMRKIDQNSILIPKLEHYHKVR